MPHKTTRCFISLCATLALAAVVVATSAASALAVTISWSPVPDAGNAADPATGHGAVGYAYSIGTYDVTIGQYTEFLNKVAKTDTYGLYNTNLAHLNHEHRRDLRVAACRAAIPTA